MVVCAIDCNMPIELTDYPTAQIKERQEYMRQKHVWRPGVCTARQQIDPSTGILFALQTREFIHMKSGKLTRKKYDQEVQLLAWIEKNIPPSNGLTP